MITAKIDLTEALSGLNLLQNDLIEHIGIAIEKSAFLIQRNAKKQAPTKTGNLKNRIEVDKIGELTYSITPKAKYSVWVHDGTDPHYIEGNNYLYWKGALHPVTHVFHPGTKPNPFMIRGLDDSEDEIKDVFERELSKAVDNFNK